MDIQILREYVTLAKLLNFTKAAKKLHLSQPTLSKHVAQLEQEIGARLLHRSTSSVSLTPAGDILLNECISIVNHWDYAVGLIKGETNNKIVVKVAGHRQDKNLLDLLMNVSPKISERINIELLPEAKEPYLTMLDEGQADIACMFGELAQFEGMGYAAIPLFTEESLLIIGEESSLSSRTEVSLEEIEGMTLIILYKNDSRDIFDQLEKRLSEIYPILPFTIEVKRNLEDVLIPGLGSRVMIIPETGYHFIKDVFDTPIVGIHLKEHDKFDLQMYAVAKSLNNPAIAEVFSEFSVATQKETTEI